MLLPVATQFDEESNTLSAETDELGTYCVLDMEVLMQNFGIEPTALTSPQYVVMAPVASFEKENTEDTENEAPAEENSEETSNGSEYSITFVLDGRSNAFTTEEFDYINGEIKKFSDEVLSYKPNTTIRTVTQEASFFDSLVITDEISKIVNSSKSTTKNFIFEIYNQTDAVFEQNIADELCTNANNANVNISIISPSESALSGFQQELSKNTDGLAINALNDFNFEKIYNHVYGKPLAEQEFKAVLITGLQPVKLNGRLNAFNGIDTDSDTLSDWDEIDVNHWIEMGLIRYDNDGEIVLPTIAQCMMLTEKPYVEAGLERYLDGYMDFIKDMRVLPIVSDPTNPDTDRDGYDDEQDLAPMTPFVNPIILLHGRVDNTSGAFGVITNSSSINNCYGIGTTGNSVNYSEVESHIIDKTINGKLGWYLEHSQKYIPNRNLFAFNYPNEDFAMNNGPRLKEYIENLKSESMKSVKVKGYLSNPSDIFATKENMKKGNARFILIGHSNGGLVSRYYIENMGGDKNVDKLITIDTPHMGASIGLLGGQVIPLSKLSTFTNFVGLNLDMAKPLDAELRPNSSLFTGEETDYYSYGFGFYPYFDITGRIALKNQFMASDKLKYIQDNQSPQLTGNVNIDNSDFKTKYYAIGGVSLSNVDDKIFGNRIIVVEFEPDYSSKTNFNNNMVLAEKRLYPNMKSYLDICESDNVVELSSQLGVRFDGDSISEYIAFKRMTVIAHDGKNDSVTEHYHGKVLSEPRMHEVVNEYILD